MFLRELLDRLGDVIEEQDGRALDPEVQEGSMEVGSEPSAVSELNSIDMDEPAPSYGLDSLEFEAAARLGTPAPAPAPVFGALAKQPVSQAPGLVINVLSDTPVSVEFGLHVMPCPPMCAYGGCRYLDPRSIPISPAQPGSAYYIFH